MVHGTKKKRLCSNRYLISFELCNAEPPNQATVVMPFSDIKRTAFPALFSPKPAVYRPCLILVYFRDTVPSSESRKVQERT